MPYLAALIVGYLAQAMAGLVGRVIIALFLTTITVTGIDVALSALLTYVTNATAGMPSMIVQFLGWMQIDKAIAIVSGCISSAVAIKGITSGSMTKWVAKKS